MSLVILLIVSVMLHIIGKGNLPPHNHFVDHAAP